MTIEAKDELRAGAIDPAALEVMTEAYEGACRELGPQLDEATRLRLAHGIVAYARGGTMDPEILKSLALRLVKGEDPGNGD